MRVLLIDLLFISLVWRTAIAYDSCNIDNYQSVLIDPTTEKHRNYSYLGIDGLCVADTMSCNRGDVLQQLTRLNTPDTDGDLSVFFPDSRGRQIKNQFNQAPYCLAFIIGEIKEPIPTVLMWSDEGEPLLTVGPVIKLTISGRSVSFHSTFTTIIQPVRLQICANGTHATYYIECLEMETKPFMMTSSSGIRSLSVIGKRNQTTFLFDEVYVGGVQQLYSVQCGNPRVDLRLLSSIQCRSVTRCDEKDCQITNPEDILHEIIDALPKPPVEVLSFCDIVAWHNSPNISVEEISGYDVRLISWDASKVEIRHTDGYEPFIVLDRERDACFKLSNSTVEIRPTMLSSPFGSVGPFSKPVKLGCTPPGTPCVHFELNGNKYVNNSAVSITEVGEGEKALLCKTNKNDCCVAAGNRYGEFYYPNGVKVPIKKYSHGFYRNRGNQVVRLNRRVNENIEGPTGVYCCVVVDTCDVEQKICIELKD